MRDQYLQSLLPHGDQAMLDSLKNMLSSLCLRSLRLDSLNGDQALRHHAMDMYSSINLGMAHPMTFSFLFQGNFTKDIRKPLD